MKLGIFDSGIGGTAIARTLQLHFPSAELIVVNDRKNIPYGDKEPSEIIQMTDTAIQPLLSLHCDAIVIACNTATALAIDSLRASYPDQLFIGIEPMIKTAARLTKTRTVAVCATPGTLNSHRYQALIAKYGKELTILEPDCSGWAYAIENDLVSRPMIEESIDTLCKQGADIIVLGCTHYHWIKDLITQVAGNRARVIDPSDAIGKRLTSLLKFR